MIATLALLACNTDPQHPGGTNPLPTDPPVTTEPPVTTPEPPAAVCDAGDDVWVQRVFPLLLGRKPHGASEVRLWADLAAAEGRPAVVRALAGSTEFGQWWKLQMSDMIYVAREGYYTDEGCFEQGAYNNHDGDLAAFILGNAPDDGTYSRNFNMADVMIDAIVVDDISVVYQANLFAKTNFTDVMTLDPIEAETSIRKYQGDQILEVYTDRNVNCMGCHNSEFSVTDDPDPSLDRAWGRGAMFERALFGQSTGPADVASFYAMSKAYGVMPNFYIAGDNTVFDDQPWGMDTACGQFSTYDRQYDYLGVDDAYFGGEFGSTGSVWEMERLFASGVASMRGTGVQFEADGTIDPGAAFAYLTAQNFVDQTWKMAFGNRLLLPYGMSRNQDQIERLSAMTDHFVQDGWSLVELMVDITSDPYFNAGLPETCSTEPYGMAPVVDPYTVFEEGDAANNGPGDLVHRHTARTLLNSTYDALAWGEPTEYFGFAFNGDDELELQTALGVFHSDAAPGFNGVDFQGALTWESTFYACSNPNPGPSYLRELYDAAVAQDGTVEDLVLGLKDRLLAHGVIDDEDEQALIEALLQMPLVAKVADADQMLLAKNLGLLCGVITQSPEFLMTVEPLPVGPIPRLDPRAAETCATFEELTSAAGISATCE